jgi:hypothetical protein
MNVKQYLYTGVMQHKSKRMGEINWPGIPICWNQPKKVKTITIKRVVTED